MAETKYWVSHSIQNLAQYFFLSCYFSHTTTATWREASYFSFIAHDNWTFFLCLIIACIIYLFILSFLHLAETRRPLLVLMLRDVSVQRDQITDQILPSHTFDPLIINLIKMPIPPERKINAQSCTPYFLIPLWCSILILIESQFNYCPLIWMCHSRITLKFFWN